MVAVRMTTTGIRKKNKNIVSATCSGISRSEIYYLDEYILRMGWTQNEARERTAEPADGAQHTAISGQPLALRWLRKLSGQRLISNKST